MINTSNLIWTFSNEQVDPFLAQSSDPYAPNFVMPNYGYAIGVVANSTANVASQRSSYDDNGAWYRRVFRCCNKGRQGPKREHGCAARHSRKSVSASAQFSGRSQFGSLPPGYAAGYRPFDRGYHDRQRQLGGSLRLGNNHFCFGMSLLIPMSILSQSMPSARG